MAITDIQISEELTTNAPSIKYSGNEGPKSPQEEQQMMADAILQEEYEKYVFDLLEIRPEATPMTLEEFKQMVLAEGQMSGGQPLPQDPTKPVNPFAPKPTGPVLPDRQMAAYGGIMGMDGRRRYGLGSFLKKTVRKIIPNEVAKIAVKAAPFVAPFNPLLAGAMSGIGSFDQTGRIGSSLKSGLMNYAMGQGARYLGGADFQKGINPFGKTAFTPGTTGSGTFSKYFSKPTGSGGIKNLFKDKASVPIKSSDGTYTPSTFNENFSLSGETGKTFGKAKDLYSVSGDLDAQAVLTDKALENVKLVSQDSPLANLKSKIMEYVPTSLAELNPLGESFNIKKAIGAGGIFATATALLGNPDDVTDKIMDRGEGMDVEAIRAEVIEAFQDPSGDKLAALRIKYPYLGRMDTKDFAMGGRIGKAEGGLMDLGGMEKDYRAEGGFVPIGKAEKADDVPARLSVNEFVFTADAVRNAGGGDIDKGAEVMENMMKHLEQGGQVSDESQGMAGAQQMFETSERLSEVI